MSDVTPTETITLLDTPAKAYDETQERMVRIPVQFPDPPVTLPHPALVATTVINTEVAEGYDAPAGQLISIAEPLTQSATLNLGAANFHPVTGFCIVKVKASPDIAADSSLKLALGDGSIDLNLNANDDLSISTALTIADGKLGFVLINVLSH